MNLTDLGWDDGFAEEFAPHAEKGRIPVRVGCEERGMYRVYGERGLLKAKISGAYRHHATSKADFPAVGDWAIAEARPKEKRVTLHGILQRRSSFSRKVADLTSEEHVLAANVDTALLVSDLGRDFNVRRIERYLALAWDSGASPVVILNKADLCDDLDARVAEVEAIAVGVPIHTTSALSGDGIEVLLQYVPHGRTAVLLGSSGVGKSSIINHILGEDKLKVGAVREDDGRGRHTTTHREIILLHEAGIIIDTPGMRELQLWSDEEGLRKVFDEIEQLGEGCRFRDCTHEKEPGCAVQAAVEAGGLDADRLESYHKLQRELEYTAIRRRESARGAEKAKYRNMMGSLKRPDIDKLKGKS